MIVKLIHKWFKRGQLVSTLRKATAKLRRLNLLIKFIQRKLSFKGFIQKKPLFKGVFKRGSIIGLDLGMSSIKLAQFIKKEDGLNLIKIGSKEIPHRKDEDVRGKEILPALRRLLQGVAIKKSKFVISINCPKTAMRKVSVPYMPKGELRQGIKLEAKNYFPFPIDQAEIGFEILSDIVEKGVKKYQVVVVTSPKDTINKYLSLLEKVRIKPVSFVSTSYALVKLVQNLQIKDNKIRCFVDIGECYGEVAIFAGRDLEFQRKIPVAGGDFTKAMTQILLSDRGKIELSLKEAEKIKRTVGIPAAGESKIIDNKISTTQILSMVRIPLEHLVNEIDRCFDYYREESGGRTINSLILLGRGALLKGLAEFLSKELGIKVNVGIESLKIKSAPKVKEEKDFYQSLMAIGAGLTEGKGINLLPLKVKERTKRTIKRTTIEVATAAIILILAFIYIGMRIQLTNFHKRIDVGKKELASLQPQLKSSHLQALAKKILRNEPYWEDVFKELSNVIPSNIYLTKLAMENKLIKMQGVIVSQDPEKSLSKFILTLEKGIFKSVKLVVTKRIEGEVANEFELRCRVD